MQGFTYVSHSLCSLFPGKRALSIKGMGLSLSLAANLFIFTRLTSVSTVNIIIPIHVGFVKAKYNIKKYASIIGSIYIGFSKIVSAEKKCFYLSYSAFNLMLYFLF